MPVVEALRLGPRTEQIVTHEVPTQRGIKFGVYTPYGSLTNEKIESWKVIKKDNAPLLAAGIAHVVGADRRFVAADDETPIEMGQRAALAALGEERQIDAVLVSTSYPIGVNVSNQISSLLELTPTYNTDIHAACSGFARGLYEIWDQTKKAEAGDENAYSFRGKRVMLIASEKYSNTVVDLQEEGGYERDNDMNQTIFSDGAIAVVFTYGEDLEVLTADKDKLPEEFAHLIKMPIDESLAVAPCIIESVPVSDTENFEQQGHDVFRAVGAIVPEKHAEITANYPEVDTVFPHQGTGRMVKSLASKKPYKNYNVYEYDENGNFSSASAAMALMRGFQDGTVKPGDTVAIEQFGAGMFYANAIVWFSN